MNHWYSFTKEKDTGRSVEDTPMLGLKHSSNHIKRKKKNKKQHVKNLDSVFPYCFYVHCSIPLFNDFPNASMWLITYNSLAC